MKRKSLIIATLVVLAVIALFFLFKDYFIPQQIINDGQTVLFSNVLYLNEETAVDTDKIVSIIKNYKAVQSFKDYTPYSQDAVRIEINMVVQHRPVHVLLGDFDIWYESADMGAYEIIDGDKLQSELEALLS